MKKLILFYFLFFGFDSYCQTEPEDNVLFNAFKQGSVDGGGNCASIALIKACIGTLGIGNVFSYHPNDLDSSIIVKLRNDRTLRLTYYEIIEATKENGFEMRLQTEDAKRIKNYADTCFAVMTKMNQIIGKYNSYSESLTVLLNGYNTPNVCELLGVQFKEIPTRELKTSTNIVTYNFYHAVYSSYGYYDETKSSTGYLPNSKFNNNRFGIMCSWYGCKQRRAFKII